MEIGNIITFNGQNWLVEDIKYVDDEKDVIILSKTNLIPVKVDLPKAIFKEYPLPWKLDGFTILAADDEFVLEDSDIELLKLIVSNINKKNKELY